MSFSHLPLRRMASFVLLGWVFALGVSVAHACGVVLGLADDGHGAEAVQFGVALDHAATATTAGDPAPGSANSSCVNFCDESKNSASGPGTIVASTLTHLNSVPLLLLQPDLAILLLRAAWMHDQGWRSPRAVAIELLRLTR